MTISLNLGTTTLTLEQMNEINNTLKFCRHMAKLETEYDVGSGLNYTSAFWLFTCNCDYQLHATCCFELLLLDCSYCY